VTTGRRRTAIVGTKQKKGASAVLDTPRLKVDDDAILAMADRLFIEFAGQPAGSVLRAIANAHATLRGQDRASYSPEEVAEHARGVLGCGM
jgi:hypothetical protein